MVRPTIVTAGLPYANGSIHIGHLVEYIMTDVYVRALRLAGEEAYYICADDTHGTPIELNARKLGIEPEAFIARFAREHVEDFTRFGIRFDNYASTNAEENRKWVNEIYGHLRAGGHLETRKVEQYFDESAGRFLPDRFIKGTCPKCATPDQYGDACEQCGTTYEPTDLKDPVSVITGTRPVLKASEHLFIGLAQFSDVLRAWVGAEGRLQPEVKNWVDGWLEGGLKDWCISRDAPYFGFEIPDMPGKFFYVWVDAPIGYISSTDSFEAGLSTGRPMPLVDFVWREKQGRIVHVIGKDIVYFHTLFWPAMLHASKLALPDHVHVHGFLTVDGVKMSKSRGTFINARTFAEHLDPIYLRYYLASKTGPSIDDIDLVLEEFVDRINADLIGKLVNLVSRAASFLATKLDGQYGTLPSDAATHLDEAKQLAKAAEAAYAAFDSASAVRNAVEIARIGNKIFQDAEPWKQLKSDPEGARNIVTLSLNLARSAAVVLAPALPAFAAKIYPILGLAGEPTRFAEAWDFDLVSRPMGKPERIFDRIERSALDAIIEASKDKTSMTDSPSADATTSADANSKTKATAKAKNTAKDKPTTKEPDASTETGTDEAHISIDTFAKVDLRVGLILEANLVEGAEKLLRLTVDLGEARPRTIFAGIRQAFEPAAVQGLRVAVVANLAPRKMRFGVSEGMVLAAGPGGKDLSLLTLPETAKPGEKIS